MQTETLQQKAMQDIFALDDAVSQFESFGSQLDLGLPPVEDDAPKSFDDMLEVNPSNEPMEFGENFMSEGDDLQDKQTQKFVVDEFAKEAAKLPDGGITAADITGISAVIQMNNHITGDVRSFIQQTIDHAVQAQQQQNVSDAQPNGTVAQDIAKTGDAGAEADAAPVDGGIPPMEPVDPTAEPSLEPNPDAGLDELGGDPLAEMPGAADLGGGLDDINASLDSEGGEAPVAEDPLASAEDTDVLGGEGEPAPEEGAEPASAESELDNFLDSDDDLDKDADLDADKPAEDADKPADEEPKEEPKEEGDDKESDSDDDFNFEAIATKAQGLVEGQDAPEDAPADASAETPAEPDAVADAGETEGTAAATEDLGGTDDAAPVQECGAGAEAIEPVQECGDAPSAETAETAEPVQEGEEGDVEAKVEAIVSDAKMKMAADKAKSILESYNDNRDRENVLAKLDGVVSNLRKSIQTESIVANYAKESKKQAELEALAESVYNKDTKADKAPSVFESTMTKIDEALKAAPKASVKEEADKVIAEFESAQKETKAEPVMESVEEKKPEVKVDPKQAKIDALIESAATKASAENKFTAKLGSILESVKQSKASKDLDDQLNALVNEVKGA